MSGITLLTTLINHLACDADTNSFMYRNVFMASRGTPLIYTEKDNKMRNLGVGCTLEKIYALNMKSHVQSHAASAFALLQLCMRRGGVEGAIHLHRARLDIDKASNATEDWDTVYVSLDQKQAFDRVSRTLILAQVKKHIPDLLHYVTRMFAHDTYIITQGLVFAQKTGVVQGAILSPILFCLAFMVVLEAGDTAMKAAHDKVPAYAHKHDPIITGYMDDLTIAAPFEQALIGARACDAAAEKYGFTPATGAHKNHLWAPHPAVRAQLDDTYTLNNRVTIHTSRDAGTAVLGAPMGDDTWVQSFMSKKVSLWNERLSQLRLLSHTQVNVLLTRMCEVSRIVFYLRTVPSSQWHDSISKARDNMYTHLLHTCKSDQLELSLYGKTMAHLPLRYGGAGITDPVAIADISYKLYFFYYWCVG